MYKNVSFKEKYADLENWVPYLIEAVKKDLRNEHLKKDYIFVKKFLPSKNIHKATIEELSEAYRKAIQEEPEGEQLAEFITSRWLLKNSELYEFFEKELSKIDPNFTELEELDQKNAQTLIQASVKEFGALHTYLFSVLNSVVFPKKSFEDLKKDALETQEQKALEAKKLTEDLSIEQMRKTYESDLARMSDKFEKKLSGLQKKYLTDVENLKKQVALLQRKLQDKSS